MSHHRPLDRETFSHRSVPPAGEVSLHTLQERESWNRSVAHLSQSGVGVPQGTMGLVWTALALYYLVTVAHGGYYKIRPPHPPHPPPPTLHYGPHPPHHHPHHSSRIYPPYPPFRSPHHRLYHPRYPKPPPPPPPPPPSYWKNNYAPSFRAPIIQETFNSPHNHYPPPTFLKEDDRGPIHTIPAPNLGPGDRPGLPNLFHSEGFKQDLYKQHDGIKKPAHSKPEDLAAVLRHGITKVNVPHSSGYQVTEDPAAASPYNTGSSSYFAPDPDPEVPSLKIPPTTDPFSRPSNGQVPLDLYLQQQAEKNGQYGHYQQSADDSNKLTPQELFNLLNYQQPSTHQQQFMLPHQTSQLFTGGHKEYLQPEFPSQHFSQQQLAQQEFTNQHLAHLQHTQHELTSQHKFSQPQYQSFNYEEQGQQSAYEDLRLDLKTKGFGVDHNEFHKDPLDDNDVAGSERQESYDNIVRNEVQQRQKDEYFRKEKENMVENVKDQFPKKQITSDPNVYRPNLISSNDQNEKLLSHDQNQETSVQRGDPAHENKNSEQMASVKPENNVQLQKSIQIYENTYDNNQEMIKESGKNTSDFKNEYTDEKKMDKELAIGNDDKNFKNDENVHFVDAVPYGSRIRPKRF